MNRYRYSPPLLVALDRFERLERERRRRQALTGLVMLAAGLAVGRLMFWLVERLAA